MQNTDNKCMVMVFMFIFYGTLMNILLALFVPADFHIAFIFHVAKIDWLALYFCH